MRWPATSNETITQIIEVCIYIYLFWEQSLYEEDRLYPGFENVFMLYVNDAKTIIKY